MNKQNGSTIIVAMILLTIITLVAVYALEGSNIQSKMVANTIFKTLTYQECRNEQEANVRTYNQGSAREILLDLQQTVGANVFVPTQVFTTDAANPNPPQSEALNVSWSYIRLAPDAREGMDLGSDSQIVTYLYENNCVSQLRFATNDQTLGAAIDGLKANYQK